MAGFSFGWYGGGVDLYEDLWIVLRWPTNLLTEKERYALEEYLDDRFSIDIVRYEAGDPSSAVEVLGSAQGVVREAVLEYIQAFIANPTTELPRIIDEPDDDE